MTSLPGTPQPDLSDLPDGALKRSRPAESADNSVPGLAHDQAPTLAPAMADMLDPTVRSSSRWESLRGDLAGGVTSGIVALPQTITIGALAFAPLGPGYLTFGILAGFYCSIVAGGLVALFGGTRFGVGGPRSSFSVVMALIVAALAAREIDPLAAHAVLSAEGATRVLVLCFFAVSLAGLLQVIFGAIGVGSYIKFIPHPVVAGFMNGLAFLILASQLPTLLGLKRNIDWWDLPVVLNLLEPEAAAVALVTMLTMLFTARRWPRLPGAIVGVVIGTLTYYALLRYWPTSILGVLDLGPVVGTIPPKFPAPVYLEQIVEAAFESDTRRALWYVAPSIAVLAILGALESLMCAVAVGQVSGRRPEANRELMAQGASNIVGGAFGAVFGGSTASRTLLNYYAGGRGRMSGLVHAGVMLLALMTASYWVAYLPHVVLSAVLTYIAITMFDGWTRQIVKRLRHRNVHREVYTSFAIVVLVTVATVAFNLLAGVVAGVIATVIVFVNKSSQSVVHAVYRGDKRHSLKLRSPEKTAYLREHGARIMVVELEGTLFFGTADHLSLMVEQLAPGADFVIFDFRRVTELDATGAHILEQIGARLHKQGKTAVLAHLTPNDANGQFIAGMGVTTAIPLERWFPDADYALEWCEGRVLARAFPEDETQYELPVAQLGIARDCTPDEVAVLARHLERRTFDAGEYLFREGDAGDRLYVAAQGVVSIKLPRRKGQRAADFGAPAGSETLGTGASVTSRRLVTLSPGVMFGEMVLVENQPRSADAVVEEYAVVYSLSRAALESLRVNHPSLSSKLLLNMSRLLADRLRTTTEELRAAAS